MKERFAGLMQRILLNWHLYWRNYSLSTGSWID